MEAPKDLIELKILNIKYFFKNSLGFVLAHWTILLLVSQNNYIANGFEVWSSVVVLNPSRSYGENVVGAPFQGLQIIFEMQSQRKSQKKKKQ